MSFRLFFLKTKSIFFSYQTQLAIVLIGFQLNSQTIRVTDNKGTIIEVNNIQVTTSSSQPNTPLVGDVWFDSIYNTVNVWDASNWLEVSSIRNWISLSSFGVYATNQLVSYNGAVYKNLTGVNSDSVPSLYATNWKTIGSDSSEVPLWKSNTNEGSYLINAVINYNGILYKNLTGVNTDVVPLSDSVNWEDTSDKIKAMGKVNANGTVSKVLFNASANRLSAGVYEITFATPMIDAHYIIQLTMKYNSGAGNGTMDITYYDQTTTSFKVDVINSVADFQFMFTVLDY